MKYLLSILFFSIIMISCTIQDQDSQVRDQCITLQGDSKDRCLHSFVKNSINELVPTCAKIIGKEERTECYKDLMSYNQNLFDCQLIEDAYARDECFISLGTTQRLGMCSRISNLDLKDECYRENVVFFEFTEEICEKIANSEIKAECYTSLSERCRK